MMSAKESGFDGTYIISPPLHSRLHLFAFLPNMLIIEKYFSVGEVTSRNQPAYSWGHLVHNNTVT